MHFVFQCNWNESSRLCQRLYNGFKQMGFTITLGDYNQMSLYLFFRADLSGE